MPSLILVSFVWAFSFGLIKGQLTGIDPILVTAARLFLAWLVFIPFTRIKHLRTTTIIALLAIGAIQYGVMYMAYTAAFHYLKGYQVALFTIFTPIYVTVVNDFFTLKFHRRFMAAALLAVLGTCIILYRDLHLTEFRTGFLLIQAANLSFAFGQVAYKRAMRNIRQKDHQVFSFLYLGAILSTLPFLPAPQEWGLSLLTGQQILSLIYLGVLASGVCFFLWNFGARRVDTGTLAVFNNLKIPLAIGCSALIFNEQINWTQLILGSIVLMIALWFNRREETI